jgi:thioredoxin 2
MASPSTLDDRGIVIACPSCGQKNRLAYERLADPVRCGKCKQPLTAPDKPLEISSAAEFDRLIGRSSVPVIVDYWAPWCGPCRMVAPELEKVAARNIGKALIVKVNTDQVPELGERFRIMSIPTVAVFTGGREAGRAVGARPAEEFERLLRQAFASSNA